MAGELARAHAERFKHSAAELPACGPGEGADAALDALIAHAKSRLGDEWPVVHRFALDAMLTDQKNDLEEFGVEYEHWFSEQSLHAGGGKI